MMKVTLSTIAAAGRPAISSNFLNNLTRLFKKGEYVEVLAKIDASEYKNSAEVLKLKAVVHRAIGEENMQLSKHYEAQAKQMSSPVDATVVADRKPPIVKVDVQAFRTTPS